MAAREVCIRRGTTEEHNSFTGKLAEVTMDTDLKTLRVHDGQTVGGIILARQSDLENIESGANENLSNITAAAKKYIADLCYPGNQYIDFTLGQSGNLYSAPNAGYFYLEKYCNPGEFCQMINTTTHIAQEYKANTLIRATCFVPVRKNEKVSVSFNSTQATLIFRFIYAQGEL